MSKELTEEDIKNIDAHQKRWLEVKRKDDIDALYERVDKLEVTNKYLKKKITKLQEYGIRIQELEASNNFVTEWIDEIVSAHTSVDPLDRYMNDIEWEDEFGD